MVVPHVVKKFNLSGVFFVQIQLFQNHCLILRQLRLYSVRKDEVPPMILFVVAESGQLEEPGLLGVHFTQLFEHRHLWTLKI